MNQIFYIDGQNLPPCPFTVCSQDGEVLRTGSAPLNVIPMQGAVGETVFVGYVNQQAQYVDLTTTTVMQKQQITPTVNGLELSNLPSPCIVTVEDQRVEVTGGTIILEFDVPGEYSITLEAPKHLQTIIQVTQP